MVLTTFPLLRSSSSIFLATLEVGTKYGTTVRLSSRIIDRHDDVVVVDEEGELGTRSIGIGFDSMGSL